MLKKTVTLTDADIKQLPVGWQTNAAFPIIAPSEPALNYNTSPTKLFIPILATIVLDTAAGAYANLDAAFAKLRLVWGRDWSFSVAQLAGALNTLGTMVGDKAPYTIQTLTINNLLASTAKNFASFLPIIHDGGFSGAFLNDNGLYIVTDNGATVGPYTNGNVANTMKVTVYYDIVDI